MQPLTLLGKDWRNEKVEMNKPQETSINIVSKYNPKTKTVTIMITNFTAFTLPFDILKGIYYKMSEEHKKAQILMPKKDIVGIDGKPITKRQDN